jgi:drug/metabolite transporter (DMT)-like permease
VTDAVSTSAAARPRPIAGGDLASVAACSLIWGTTWFAITLQFGSVPSVVSVVYRFAIAAALIFAWCVLTRTRLKLTPAQHLAAIGQGLFTFGGNYPMVYLAEERVASAVVAVMFAGLAFVNLVLFRFVYGTKAAWTSWAGALLGLAGVLTMSLGQLLNAHMDQRAVTGLALAAGSVIAAAIGNLFAHRSQKAGTEVAPSTAWAMAYGAGLLALAVLATGTPFRFDPRPAYSLSLVYLSVFGSVIAFLVYFALARRRSYTFASYVSALTPPIALGMSVAFEHAHFGWEAVAGVALVLAGQALLIRSPKKG